MIMITNCCSRPEKFSLAQDPSVRCLEDQDDYDQEDQEVRCLEDQDDYDQEDQEVRCLEDQDDYDQERDGKIRREVL